MYKPLVGNQEKKSEEKPNYEVELAAQKARNEEMEKRMTEKSKEWDERKLAYDEQVKLANMRKDTPPQYQSQQPDQQAMIDLGISKEDFVQSGPEEQYAMMMRVQDYMNAMRQESQQTVSRAGQLIQGLSERTHKAEVRALVEQPFYKYAKSDIEAYYDAHPQEKVPGVGKSPEEVYKLMVGENWESYYGKKQSEAPAVEGSPGVIPPEQRPKVQTETPVRPNAPTGPNIHTKKTEVTLTPEEEETRRIFNKLEPGLNISAEEWVAISSGKVLPKKMGHASDWQVTVPKDYRVSTGEDN